MPRPSPEKLHYPATRLTADELLVAARACHEGDLGARDRLLAHYTPMIVAGAWRCRRTVDRNDVIHDVIVEVLRALGRFDPGEGIPAKGVQIRLTSFVSRAIKNACHRSPSRQSVVAVAEDAWTAFPEETRRADKTRAFSTYDRPGKSAFASRLAGGLAPRREVLMLQAGAILGKLPRAETGNLELAFGVAGGGSHELRQQKRARGRSLFPVAMRHAQEVAADLYPEGIDE